jgi:hypothetical protein
MPTATTVPFLILMLLLWRWTKGNLLAIILFTSIFGAASVLNLGGTGLAPWLLALAIGLIVKLLQGFCRPQFMSGCNIPAVRLLLAFIGFTILSSFAYPVLFHGVPVFSAHSLGQGQVPLSWGTANAFQVCYLLAAVAIYFLALLGSRASLQVAMDWYLRGCLVICFFAMYQLANGMFHIPYPSPVLYSNPSYVIFPAYKINGFWRLTSTLTEASSMAFYLGAGIALQGWQMLARPLKWKPAASFALMVVCLLLTQSSTGYLLLLFIMAVGCPIYALSLFRRRAIPRAMVLVLLPAAMVGTVLFTTTSASTIVGKEIQSVLLDKKNSSSYKERTESNIAAMQAARQTFYLGTGWGSLRCSGLGYLLIGTVGIPGLLLFVVFFSSLFFPLLRRPHRETDATLFEGSLFATTLSERNRCPPFFGPYSLRAAPDRT